MSVADVLPQEKAALMYGYGFGDGWEHNIKLEKRLSNLYQWFGLIEQR